MMYLPKDIVPFLKKLLSDDLLDDIFDSASLRSYTQRLFVQKLTYIAIYQFSVDLPHFEYDINANGPYSFELATAYVPIMKEPKNWTNISKMKDSEEYTNFKKFISTRTIDAESRSKDRKWLEITTTAMYYYHKKESGSELRRHIYEIKKSYDDKFINGVCDVLEHELEWTKN